MLVIMRPLMADWSSIAFPKDLGTSQKILAVHVLYILYFPIYILLKVSYKVNRKNLSFVCDEQIMKSLFKNEVLIQFLEYDDSSISKRLWIF
jgi:hypothetical protein